jgi:hypothetical protein
MVAWPQMHNKVDVRHSPITVSLTILALERLLLIADSVASSDYFSAAPTPRSPAQASPSAGTGSTPTLWQLDRYTSMLAALCTVALSVQGGSLSLVMHDDEGVHSVRVALWWLAGGCGLTRLRPSVVQLLRFELGVTEMSILLRHSNRSFSRRTQFTRNMSAGSRSRSSASNLSPRRRPPLLALTRACRGAEATARDGHAARRASRESIGRHCRVRLRIPSRRIHEPLTGAEQSTSLSQSVQPVNVCVCSASPAPVGASGRALVSLPNPARQASILCVLARRCSSWTAVCRSVLTLRLRVQRPPLRRIRSFRPFIFCLRPRASESRTAVRACYRNVALSLRDSAGKDVSHDADDALDRWESKVQEELHTFFHCLTTERTSLQHPMVRRRTCTLPFLLPRYDGP